MKVYCIYKDNEFTKLIYKNKKNADKAVEFLQHEIDMDVFVYGGKRFEVTLVELVIK